MLLIRLCGDQGELIRATLRVVPICPSLPAEARVSSDKANLASQPGAGMVPRLFTFQSFLLSRSCDGVFHPDTCSAEEVYVE